jgi:iron(III) transport system ATP-binding protein
VSYAERLVLRDVSAHVSRGAFACLLGPSGCGKTTLLRAIAGFEPPAKGCIRIGECEVAKPGFSLPPERRRVGMVFQENALFPHLTVAGNVAFGLRREAPRVREATVHELLDVVGLEGLSRRYAHELSGGQQQRVALARALAPKPDVLLLDEPFSSLDTELRERIGIQVRDVLKAREVTTLLVTHDQSEAFALSDHIGVMREGSILQWDSAYNLYHEPANRFVADFVGQGAFVHGRMLGPDTIETELGVLTGNRAYDWPLGCEVDVLLRPDDIQPDPNAEITATIIERAFKGAEILYYLKLSTGSLVLSLFPSHLDHRTGESVGIRVCPDHLVAFRV